MGNTEDETDIIDELTKKDLEIARAEVNKTEFAMSTRQKVYAWTVMMIILLCNISNQWQRFIIASAYQIRPADGEQPDKKYQMRYAIPNFGPDKYSYLAGATFTIFFATAVLFTGILADNMSRKILLCLAAIFWSLTSIGTSFCKTYW
jgi:MFS family permease